MKVSINLLQKLTIAGSFVLVVTVNALANILPFNGKSTAAVSAQYPVYFTPANYVFSIWGLIYIALLGYTLYNFFAKGHDKDVLAKTGKWFIVTNLLNSLWMFAWHYDQIFLTVLLMIGILVSLIKIFTIIQSERLEKPGRNFNVLISFPFSLYLGWISVATIANVSALLFFWNFAWFGISGVAWTVLLIVIATGLGLAAIGKYRNVVYPLVIAWAVWGISMKFPGQELIVFVATVTVSVLLAAVLFTTGNKIKNWLTR